MSYRLTLFEDRIEPTASLRPLGRRHRVIYVASGAAEIGGASVVDDAWYGADTVLVSAGREGARLWRWELARAGTPPELAAGDGVVSVEKLSATLDDLVPEGNRWLIRCDGVAFPPGGYASLHVHRGPGIRCLLQGSIRIDSGGRSTLYRPGEAWFEPGPEPVFAQTDAGAPTRFIRVMILPPDLLGRSSIAYVNAEDREQPKSQAYRVYVDAPIRA